MIRWWEERQRGVRITARLAAVAACVYGLCCVAVGSLTLFAPLPWALRVVTGIVAVFLVLPVCWYGSLWWRRR